jgi:hypothetical protein
MAGAVVPPASLEMPAAAGRSPGGAPGLRPAGGWAECRLVPAPGGWGRVDAWGDGPPPATAPAPQGAARPPRGLAASVRRGRARAPGAPHHPPHHARRAAGAPAGDRARGACRVKGPGGPRRAGPARPAALGPARGQRLDRQGRLGPGGPPRGRSSLPGSGRRRGLPPWAVPPTARLGRDRDASAGARLGCHRVQPGGALAGPPRGAAGRARPPARGAPGPPQGHRSRGRGRNAAGRGPLTLGAVARVGLGTPRRGPDAPLGHQGRPRPGGGGGTPPDRTAGARPQGPPILPRPPHGGLARWRHARRRAEPHPRRGGPLVLHPTRGRPPPLGGRPDRVTAAARPRPPGLARHREGQGGERGALHRTARAHPVRDARVPGLAPRQALANGAMNAGPVVHHAVDSAGSTRPLGARAPVPGGPTGGSPPLSPRRALGRGNQRLGQGGAGEPGNGVVGLIFPIGFLLTECLKAKNHAVTMTSALLMYIILIRNRICAWSLPYTREPKTL